MLSVELGVTETAGGDVVDVDVEEDVIRICWVFTLVIRKVGGLAFGAAGGTTFDITTGEGIT